ncbi:O-methyltransferase [Mycena vulgaris]|nr:O-methyltransferase [Mycena vulgaris]
MSTLRRLANIITNAVDAMERVYECSGVPLPSLDEPFNPQDPVESLAQDPEVLAASMNLAAAAAQITATVWDPRRIIVNTANAFHLSSCLLAVSELNVTEVLREAGTKGASANEIGQAINVDPGLIARILRLLATHHIFREVSPGVFANNRVSSTLEKGKPSSLLFAKAEIGGKSGVFLADSLRNSTGQLPFNLAYNTAEPLFLWMEDPKNSYNVSRFAVGMQGPTATEPPDLIFQGFDWSLLPPKSVIVDVGGGIGHVSLTIAKKYPQLRVVNQDLGSPIEISKAHWKEHFPAHLEKQMVEFQVHDFFTPQPRKDAAVFLLRYIMHDWPDDKAAVILKHLRAVALPNARLVIVEKIVPFASAVDLGGLKTQEIPGASRATAQAPLLPNWGAAAADIYLYDLTMHVLLGGVERTVQGFWDVLAQSGWKLVQVYHCPGTNMSHLVAAAA